MHPGFTRIAFTPSVRAAQARYGSAGQYSRHDDGEDQRVALTDTEVAFIAGRDGFYQATVGETGWPYVQYRGGPPGFLRVVDAHTLGYADFRGNRQYISVGNLATSDRLALILMDYAHRQRLKIWGRARIVHASDDPDLISRLEAPAYRARVERGVLIEVSAWDWNCPQHITKRWTESELAPLVAPLEERIAELEAENAALRASRKTEPSP